MKRDNNGRFVNEGKNSHSKEGIKERNKKYREENKEKIRDYKKKWAERNKFRLKEKHKKWWEENKEEQSIKRKKNYPLKRDKIKEYRENNLNRIKETEKLYRIRNKEKILKGKKERWKRKFNSDKNFRVKLLLRTRLYKALGKYTKTGKIMSSRAYGIDYGAIIEYLKPFPKDLSNYEIHHKKPLFAFNFINPDGSQNLKEIQEAFKPENHEWLTIEEHKARHNLIGHNRKEWIKRGQNISTF